MGQSYGTWCGESRQTGGDIVVWAASHSAHSRTRLVAPRDPVDSKELLAGCPRELADALRQTGQVSGLRCRYWLSMPAFQGLLRNLQSLQLPQLMERYAEACVPDECTYTLPPVIPWSDLGGDHVMSAGQVFRREDATHDKISTMRRLGLHVLRQGKVGVVLLAGGANFRLGLANPPVGCASRLLGLCSGKSIIQLICERICRLIQLCKGPEDSSRPNGSRLSIPVFVMTSRLTRSTVVEHFEANRYFGLLPRDVFFFEQPVRPVVSNSGLLLPQSLGGEFAHAPGGTGQVFEALAGSSALEQMRDRGVECLHVMGTENLLTRACDPVFLGFCRELDVDCACKVTKRTRPKEDMELFCIRQSTVSTQYADIEEAACGLSPHEAPKAVLEAPSSSGKPGELEYTGSMNCFFITVSYIEEVVGRPVRPHREPRIVPFLDFEVKDSDDGWVESVETKDVQGQKGRSGAVGVALGSWPAEGPPRDLPCQRALAAAAVEVRNVHSQGSQSEKHPAWRCEVRLDDTDGPVAVVRVRNARRGTLLVDKSLCVMEKLRTEPGMRLASSLVVPLEENAMVLETSLLDYFAYTDRAIAFEVPRHLEYAPVRQHVGPHSAFASRAAMATLHRNWLTSAGWMVAEATSSPRSLKSNELVEVSPLLSYEGEGLRVKGEGGNTVLNLPKHLPGAKEAQRTVDPTKKQDDADTSVPAEEDIADGLDTRHFYLQEYPHRMRLSDSQEAKLQQKQPALTAQEKADIEARTLSRDYSRAYLSRKEVNDGDWKPPVEQARPL
mmetsp:Transcript_73109/g.136655  ORF Transcript_73109/g.136655 Transcript_73109/m.136655 type:complete len:783 (-) Transcript_73109:23-2371(-)